ncbi:MAG: carboxypeptidase-like regulatory domain-containing protein, partial [Bacteroidetes bacterium]|nr:carboxypeptidase-like regulatory domain-containing protein [Bacteroidota bacterium]
MSRAQSAVNGYVTDATTGETLIGASVGFPEINRGASSNTFGYYSITDLRAGTYTLQASFIGYQTLRREITLGMNETLRLDLALTPSGVELEEVVVTSEEEKEEQRDIGRAQITTKLIKEVPAVIEPDLFRSVQLLPGVASASDFSSGLYIRGGSPDQTLIL